MSERSKIIDDAANSLTLHGLPRAISTKRKSVRIIWLLAFLGSFAVLLYFVYQRVTDYYRFEIYIKTNTKIVQPLPFPAITICNSDRLNNTEGKPLKEFSMENMTCNKDANFTSLSRQETEFQKACKMFISNSNDTFRFAGKGVAGFPKFFAVTSSFYPCFTFNKDGKLKQNVGGNTKGLEMILFSDPADSLPLDMANLSRFDDRRRGILVIIHDPATGVSLDPPTNVALLTGESTEISLRKRVYHRKPAPFPSKCHTNATTYYKVIPGTYTRSNCISSCFQMKLKSRCGKQIFGNDIKSQVICKKEFYKRYPIEDCVCPSPCFEIQYETGISKSVWPRSVHIDASRESFAKMLNQTIGSLTPEALQKHLIQLKIYYQDLIVEEVTEEELYGISNLLSEIGGLMGLFIGASVISLFEFFWFSIHVILMGRRREPVTDSMASTHEEKLVKIMKFSETPKL